MDGWFVGQNTALIFVCRMAAMIGAGVALWFAWKRDFPKHDELPGRAFIFATLLAVGALSSLRALGFMGRETYSNLIVPAASMAYVSHALGAFLFVRAARFRDTYLRPQPQSLEQTLASHEEDANEDDVIRLD